MKDVIISITGSQYEASGPEDAIELVTDGQYWYKNGRWCSPARAR